MSVTIGRIQVVTEQHQEAVPGSLGGAVEVYRSYFAEMKENFRERGRARSRAARITRAADLADVPDLLRARILAGQRASSTNGRAGRGAGTRARGAAQRSSRCPDAGAATSRACSS